MDMLVDVFWLAHYSFEQKGDNDNSWILADSKKEQFFSKKCWLYIIFSFQKQFNCAWNVTELRNWLLSVPQNWEIIGVQWTNFSMI